VRCIPVSAANPSCESPIASRRSFTAKPKFTHKSSLGFGGLVGLAGIGISSVAKLNIIIVSDLQ
jgi:hypothetical protein